MRTDSAIGDKNISSRQSSLTNVATKTIWTGYVYKYKTV